MGRWQREALTEGQLRDVAASPPRPSGAARPPHRFATGRIHSPPFPFVTFSCNSDAMTSNSSQDPTDPTALVDDILAELQTAFRTSVTHLKSAIAAYVRDRTLPPADAAAKGLFDYRSEEHTSELQS